MSGEIGQKASGKVPLVAGRGIKHLHCDILEQNVSEEFTPRTFIFCTKSEILHQVDPKYSESHTSFSVSHNFVRVKSSDKCDLNLRSGTFFLLAGRIAFSTFKN